MSSELFALLSHRTLPSEHHLNVNSSCPNMDLAVFTCPSAATVASTPITSTEVPRPKSASFDTLTCYRLGNSTPTVWSVVVNQFFTGSMPCCDPSGRHVQVDPAARFDQITALHWSPDGQCLAVALGSSSATRPPALILLSVHDGQLLVPPTIIPDQSTSTEHSRSSIKTQDRSIHFAAWLPLDSPDNSSHSPEAETWQPKSAGQSLCDSLPANLTVRPMLDLEMLNNDIGAMSTSDAAGKANSSSAFRFPPSLFKGNQSLSKTGVNSLLILSSHRDQIHFFINGTVYLGSTTLPGSAQLRSVRLMALDSSHVSPETLALPPKHLGSIRLQLFWLTLDGSIGYGYLDLRSVCITRVVPGNLPLPIDSPFFSKPTLAVLGVRSKELDEQIRLSHSIHGLLRDCLFGYFSIIKEWSMCRSGAQKWYDSFDEISKAHGVLAPLSFQMLQLLFLGQASEGLRDFLGTKTAERVFSKWEFTSTGSVRKIRCTIVELLVPNLERLFVLVTELRNRVYPDITQPKLIEDSNFEDLLLVEELIKQLLFSVHDLDHKLEREEYAYKEFCKWLRSEFEFIISVETAVGPFNRPPITYDFMTVSQFIQRGNTNEVDQLISSHETCDVDQHLALQLRNHHLIQGYYEDLFDTNGPQKREKTRETLDALLDQIGNHEPQSLNSEVPPVSQPKIGTTLPIHATPDTSHFQMNPNQDFHTPGVLAHLSKRDEASLTPSNVLPHCLRRKTVPSEASPPDSKTTHIDEALGIQGETRNSRGIYANLVSCSSYLSNVMISIFERIGSNQTVEVYESQNKADLSDTPKNLLCSHYVDSCQYFAYLGTNDQIVVRRIRVDISPDQSQTFKDTQASVMCRITGKGDKTLEPVIVLDLAFFDDVELVVLGQLGIGMATRYVLLTIRYSQLFDEATNVMEYLPVYRLHQLQSEYSPEQISLNGNKGRRTGCVISGKGRVLHVFDMEDEGGSEDLEMEKDDE
ncbi:anaphase-promoting complex, cyclosome, subunit 4-domain-containing protein [Melampsora americana]|nr:anaphase-promoting complex, cyclosome, subunit 4-domain-containing protein [Melampsora americana]